MKTTRTLQRLPSAQHTPVNPCWEALPRLPRAVASPLNAVRRWRSTAESSSRVPSSPPAAGRAVLVPAAPVQPFRRLLMPLHPLLFRRTLPRWWWISRLLCSRRSGVPCAAALPRGHRRLRPVPPVPSTSVLPLEASAAGVASPRLQCEPLHRRQQLQDMLRPQPARTAPPTCSAARCWGCCMPRWTTRPATMRGSGGVGLRHGCVLTLAFHSTASSTQSK